MRFIVTFLGFLLVTVIATGVSLWRTETVSISSEVSAQNTDRSRFRLLYGSFYGDHATYTLQTPPEEKNFADDCIGCEQEVGNAVVFAEFGCLKKSEYLFDSNSQNGIVEKEPLYNASGTKIGERRIWASKDKNGKAVAARMFWIEGDDFWAVQAPTVELAKALRESEQYAEIRKKVVEEKKSYVPIQNANTIGKDRCAEFTQRRVTH